MDGVLAPFAAVLAASPAVLAGMIHIAGQDVCHDTAFMERPFLPQWAAPPHRPKSEPLGKSPARRQWRKACRGR